MGKQASIEEDYNETTMNNSKDYKMNEARKHNQNNETDLTSLYLIQDGKPSISDGVEERPLSSASPTSISATKSPYPNLFKPNTSSASNGINKRIRSKKTKRQKKKIERAFRTSVNAFGMNTNDLGQTVIANDTIDNEPPKDGHGCSSGDESDEIATVKNGKDSVVKKKVNKKSANYYDFSD